MTHRFAGPLFQVVANEPVTSGEIVTEVLVILGLLVLNGLFAMSELAIVTARQVRLEQRAEGGDAGAAAALALARDPTQFLSTVQVGITLIGVLAGAFGGATLSEELADVLARSPAIAEYAEGIALGVVVTGITYLSLLIGELIPKRVALGHPERVASLVARPMRTLARIASPIVALLTGPTNLLLRIVGIKASGEPSLTQLEIRALIEQGAESGVVDVTEHTIVESVFKLGDRQVADVMVPRTRIHWIDAADSSESVRKDILASMRPTWLYCRGHVDDVLGVVHAEDLLEQTLRGDAFDPASIVAEPLFVPASMGALDLLDRFKASGQSVAVALDEHGGVSGLVTLDELVSAVVGEIPEDGAPATALIDHTGPGAWMARGELLIEDFEAALDLPPIPEGKRRWVRTLGGFVMARLGRLPVVDEELTWMDYRLVVAEMAGRRVARVRIERRAH